MESKHFAFESFSDFHSEKSSEFAEIIISLPPKERIFLLQTFGLSLDLKSDPLKVVYEGKQVGIGALSSNYKRITFSIEPKFNDAGIKDVFNSIGLNTNVLKNIKINDVTGEASAAAGEGNFTAAFLMKIFEEISHFIKHHLTGENESVEVFRGKIKGKPLLLKSFISNTLGRDGFYCKVRNKQDLEDYYVVILATAKDILKYFNDFKNFSEKFEEDFEKDVSAVLRKMRSVNVNKFNPGLLNSVCSPPFPYGLTKILLLCRKYWNFKNEIDTQSGGASHLGFWSISISMEKVFEEYIESLLNTLESDDIQIVKKQRFYYFENRFIEPDFMIVQKSLKEIIIVDAKYQNRAVSHEQVQQMVSYINFSYPEYASYKVSMGLVLHLDNNYPQCQIYNFGKNVSFMRIPLKADEAKAMLVKFFNERLSD